MKTFYRYRLTSIYAAIVATGVLALEIVKLAVGWPN